MKRAPQKSTVAERLEFFSIPEPNSGCYLWLGRVRGEYPTMNIDGVTQHATRVAYELRYGPLPPGKLACHKCDVTLCVNDDHLFAGTHKENMADMKAKRRAAAGYKPWTSPLTPEQVQAIRADGRSYTEIARDFGLASNSVGCIKRRERWAHLP